MIWKWFICIGMVVNWTETQPSTWYFITIENEPLKQLKSAKHQIKKIRNFYLASESTGYENEITISKKQHLLINCWIFTSRIKSHDTPNQK